MKRNRFLSLVVSCTLILPLLLSGIPALAEDAAATKLYDTTDFYNTIADYEATTGKAIGTFQQAPDLAAKEAAGELPPLADRISEAPMVVVPLNEVGKYGGRIRSGATSPVTGSAETFTCRTQPLFIISSDLQRIVPNIALGYEYNDDLTELTIMLRPGMKWSDGEPFTADDFVFYYEEILLSDDILPSKPAVMKMGNDLLKIEKVDTYEVKIIFPQPNPAFSASLSNANRMYMSVPYAPAHYLKQYLPKYNPDSEANAKKAGYGTWVEYFLYIYPDEVQARADVNLPVLDPWMLVRVDAVGNKYFDRNPYYWKVDTEGNQLPYIDGQDRLVLETAAITMKLLAGELDIGLQFTAPADFALYKDNEGIGNYTTYMWQDGRGQVLANLRFNRNIEDPEKNALYNNVTFMEALSLAIDREEINDVVWMGMAVTRSTAVVPTVSFYEDRYGNYMTEYDPETANAKLDSIGLAWDAKHEFRLTPSGQPLEIIFEYVEVEGDVTTIVELLKKYWDAVGVKTTIKKLDQTLHNERTNANQIEINMWNLDNCSELGFYANPGFQANATQWDQYVSTSGANGIEPPEAYKNYRDLRNKFMSTLIGSEEYLALGKQLSEIALQEMWNIGIAGMAPKPAIISNKLQNTPERGVYDYQYRFWMIFHPEQWFFE